MTSSKEIMREMFTINRERMHARQTDRIKFNKSWQELQELRKKAEECRESNLRNWISQLCKLELKGEDKQVLDIYKMCVRNCIKSKAVFGRIENGQFVYFDPKWNSDKNFDIPDEFNVHMLDGLNLTKYDKIKHQIVPKEYWQEGIVGKIAKEYNILV